VPCKISEIDLRKRYVIEIQVLNCERRNCGLLNYKEFSASYTQMLLSSIRRGNLSEEIRWNHWQTKAKFIRPLFPSSSSSSSCSRVMQLYPVLNPSSPLPTFSEAIWCIKHAVPLLG